MEDGRLTPASPPWQMWGRAADAGPACLTDRQSPLFVGGIRASEPYDGTLAILLAASRTAPTDTPEPLPAFQFLAGIGSNCTEDPASPDFAKVCLPATTVAAAPTALGGMPVHATYDTFSGSDACEGCGFTVHDGTTATGPLRQGTFTLTRDGVVPTGITWAFGGSGSREAGLQGNAGFTATLADGAAAATAHCGLDPVGNQWFSLLLAHHQPPHLEALFDLDGSRHLIVDSVEIPIDLAATGWTMPPYATADAHAFVPTSPQTCDAPL